MKIKLGYVLLSVALMTGCVSVPDYSGMQNDMLSRSITINSFTSPEGKQTFRAVGHNVFPSIVPQGQTIENWHHMLISMEMGKRQYCQNGYTFDKTTMPPDLNMTIYDGTCK